MKRSEMVEKIAEYLLHYGGNLYGGDKEEREEARESTRLSRLKLAHYALRAVELEIVHPLFTWEVESLADKELNQDRNSCGE